MRELQKCLLLRRKIDEISDRIYELRAKVTSPKNQIITGMPRGGGSNDNVNERYLIRLEYLIEKRHKLRKYQAKEWIRAKNKIKEYSLDTKTNFEETANLFFFRYVKGLSWNKCVAKLNTEYGGWNSNKAFRINRKMKQYYGAK